MARFKPGQEVVCVRPNKPYMCNNGPKAGHIHNYGPKFNEIVNIDTYLGASPGFVFIKQYPSGPHGLPSQYLESIFEPLVSDAALREELESVPEPYTI